MKQSLPKALDIGGKLINYINKTSYYSNYTKFKCRRENLRNRSSLILFITNTYSPSISASGGLCFVIVAFPGYRHLCV